MQTISGSIEQWPEGTEEEKQEIKDLVNKSCPIQNTKLSFIKMEEEAGWTRITVKFNDGEFLIKYSSYMFDASVLSQFIAKIIDIKEEIVLFLDYEGSWPLLYINPIDDDVRFLFAHDYNLFLNDDYDIDEYTIRDYTIECDTVVNKKELLKNFYDILYPFTINYDIIAAQKGHYDDVFNIENGKKYLSKIKAYLEK